MAHRSKVEGPGLGMAFLLVDSWGIVGHHVARNRTHECVSRLVTLPLLAISPVFNNSDILITLQSSSHIQKVSPLNTLE